MPSRHELSRRKPLDGPPEQTSPGGDLRRVLGAGHLTLLAVGGLAFLRYTQSIAQRNSPCRAMCAATSRCLAR